MPIPESTPAQIIQAMMLFDSKYRESDNWMNWINKKNQYYAIKWQEGLYPPKEIIRLVTGSGNTFSGGIKAANRYLQIRGFEVILLDDGYREGAPINERTTRNPAWHRDELILALDLYFRYHPSRINKDHPEVIRLSSILNALPLHTEKPDVHRFRNSNGVHMKLGNFLRFDPTYKGKGLTAGGKLEEVIWNEFAQDRDKLSRTADMIKMGAEIHNIVTDFQVSPPNNTIQQFNYERSRNGEREIENSLLEMSDEQFNEYLGKLDSSAGLDVRQGLIKIRKYNKKIINDLKERCNHCCQICGFSSIEEYGESVVEAHHIEEFSLTQNNKPENIMIVCPNHHRLIHKTNGKFDRERLQITYANGRKELLKIISHFV